MSKAVSDTAELEVRNVGGIDSTRVTFEPGVTVLEGRNATNRTSLLQAIAAALGSSQAAMKSDADEAEVRLRIGDRTYTRTFERTADGISTGGDPYLEDAEVADLFAFLFASNEARRAVAGGENLREILMRPVDTDRIQSEIDRLRSERDRIADELDALDELAEELPELEQRRASLESRRAEKRDEIEAVREELERAEDEAVTDQREDELDDRIDDRNDRRVELENVEYRIETHRETIESLESEREELSGELADLNEPEERRIGRLRGEIDRLRERKRSIESNINQLNKITEFNAGIVEGDRPEVAEELVEKSGNVTDELVGETVVCWTCGSEVDRSAVERTLERLRELRAEKASERNQVEDEITELQSELDDLESTRERRATLESKLDRLDREIADEKDSLEDLEARRSDLREEIATLEDEIADLRRNEQDQAIERQQELDELEYELRSLKSELEAVESEIGSIEDRLEERGGLKTEREAVATELAEKRALIDEIEAEAVESFNEHVENLLSTLEYENVARVWIERREREVRRGRRTETESTFDLHVVRNTEAGPAYEDTVDTLSESEREVVGLVFALAGYLAHDVHETVPFMLLDSLEAIDAERIATLVDYFSEHADYLVGAFLPEDAAAVDADERITSF